ncbi:MAG: GNAT family N-acetyltransferase [Flavobacteriales bacterium]|nr:GNAT family N-acetyltransferase [Flavobacteriales bacterium]MBP9078671.1 GNAT family N-acetyltransferase [Flavobacteriales bacterium]
MLNLDFRNIPTLRTERLVLRPITEADAPAVFTLRSDRQTMAHIPRPVASTMADAVAHIAQILADQHAEKMLAWAITKAPSPELIGIVCLLRMRKEDLRTELGYAMIRAHWGRGLMSEAVHCVVRHAFETLRFHSVEAGVDPENTGSIRVLERTGFSQEAHFREDTFHQGRFKDTLVYAQVDRANDAASKAIGPFDTLKPARRNEAVAGRWFAAFNAHHLEALLALYADDARHFSPKLQARKPETGGWVQGKAALRDWWRDAFDRLPSLRYEPLNLIADGQAVFMEYIRHVEGEADLRVGEVLEIGNGLINASRVYHG